MWSHSFSSGNSNPSRAALNFVYCMLFLCARQVSNDFKRLSLSFFYSLIRQTFIYFWGAFQLFNYSIGKIASKQTKCVVLDSGFFYFLFCCFPQLQLFLKVFELALSTVAEKLEESIKIYNKCIKHLGQLSIVFLLLCFPSRLGEFLPPPAGRHEISVFICTQSRGSEMRSQMVTGDACECQVGVYVLRAFCL